MVQLKDDEKRMLDGAEGLGVQKAMELLVKVANAYGAERMINITYAYSTSRIIPNRGLYDIIHKFTKDAKVRVPTGCSPLDFNAMCIKRLGLPESVVKEAQSVFSQSIQTLRDLGVIPCYTCLPQFIYDLRKNEHVAFAEVNVGMLTNSWFGAMTNLEGFSTAMASAITGKTPEYGLHVPGNRYGKVLKEVASELEPDTFDYADYTALAHWTGKILGDRIVVYNGLSPNMKFGHANSMCASQIYHGGGGMFHIVGVTPEAPTLEIAFGGKKPEDVFTFGRKERRESYQDLCFGTDTKVDMVLIGCPHCTLQRIYEIAEMLKGNKINKGTRLWIGTSEVIRSLAERAGLVDLIEGAGAFILSDICTRVPAIPPLCQDLGIGTLATNSCSIAENAIRRSRGKTTTWFGTTKDCIQAAVTGLWEGQ